MYLILIGWFYITLMMAIAEASASNGTLLGALVTFTLYGLLPMAIIGFILGTPARKRRLLARRRAEQQAYEAQQPTQEADAPPSEWHR